MTLRKSKIKSHTGLKKGCWCHPKLVDKQRKSVFCCLGDFDKCEKCSLLEITLKLTVFKLTKSGVLPGEETTHWTVKYVRSYPNKSFFFCSTDDDYSDTYNATYAVINNGEKSLAYNLK